MGLEWARMDKNYIVEFGDETHIRDMEVDRNHNTNWTGILTNLSKYDSRWNKDITLGSGCLGMLRSRSEKQESLGINVIL